MKKLPTLLLILTVATMVPTGEVFAITGEAGGGEKVTTGETANIGAGAAEVLRTMSDGEVAKTELPVANKREKRFYIMGIKPREGTVDVRIDGEMENLQIQRAWFATVDYENGWTEAEVDAQLENWTTLKAEWTKVTKEENLARMAMTSYATIPLTIEGTRLQYDLTQVNLADVLYYAAEFKDMNDAAAGSIWVKGKVDYRGCAHAERFENWETGTCEEVVDLEAGTVKYRVEGATEDEEVVTWEEEWRSTLAERLSGIGAVLDGLASLAEVPEESLTQEEEKLAKVETLLEKAIGVKEELAEAERLEARIKALRERKETGSEFEEKEPVKPGEGPNKPTQRPAGGEDDAGSGDKLASDHLEGDGAVEGDVVLGGSVAGNGVVAGGIAEGSGVGSGSSVQTEGSQEKSEDNEASEGQSLEEGFIEGKTTEEAPEEAEVPKLGGAKSGAGWIWWVVGLAGVLSIGLAFLLKRRQRGGGQH